MSAEENKAIAIRHIKEVLEQGHVELINSYYCPDGSEPGMGTSEQWKDSVLWFHKTCPGFKITILDMMAEGDKVMANSSLELTYSVPTDPPPALFPPLGRPVTWRSMDVFRIVDGKMVSQQSVGGWTDMLVENGVNPMPISGQNKAVVRRLFEEAWNQGKLEQLDQYYAPDGSASDIVPLQEFIDLVQWWHKAAPGLKFTILNILAEGETVMAHWKVDVTYTNPTDPLPDEPFIPLGKPVGWKGADIYRIVDGKIVSSQTANPWYEMLVEAGAIPLKKIAQNKVAVKKFVDALNRQDTALLSEVCTPEVAEEWTEALPGMFASMKGHHIELVDMVADGECVAVKMATSGYHTGELHGIPPSGKWWTNRVFTFFLLADGKIIAVDALPDVENIIKQIGGFHPTNGSLKLRREMIMSKKIQKRSSGN